MHQLAPQPCELVTREPDPARERFRYPAGLLLQALACRREKNVDDTLVVGRTPAAHEPRHLEALEQRRERPRVEVEPLRQAPDRRVPLLPEDQHHQVLWVGDPERLEKRLVELRDGAARGVEEKADLPIEPDNLGGTQTGEQGVTN